VKPEFPNRFALTSFTGPRGQTFSHREDAFQQLVGEGLQSLAGPYAHVAATKGRDGSIDAWLESNEDLHSPFHGLPVPIIVECKDHDDTLTNFIKNIFSGWAKVKEKLKGEAGKGWTGLFSPWKNARGYAYCVSAVLHQSAREELTKEIQQFFADLPDDQRPPIEKIRILDWADLRPWLSAISRVSDAWLGTGSSAILTHSEYLASLSGFREYLLSSRLPFVSPGSTAPTSPESLFQSLMKSSEKPGILLVGSGGVGKTRTTIEVARLAEQQGWRSLHILPDEPGVTSEDLARVVLPGNSPTLLIFDYLDQMQRLDLGALRRHLIPQAEERGIRLRFFANCRPGWLRELRPARDELFTIIRLQPEPEQRNKIIHTMIATAAPKSFHRFGETELLRICGQRPIIALLIARELERRLLAGVLDSLELAALRTGDLLHWLRKRLAEDRIQVELPASPLEPGHASSVMVAAAAAFACAPNPSETLARAAGTAAETRGEQCDGKFVVAALESLGWLVKDGGWLASAHDVVADEVFDQVIRENDYVRSAEFVAVLSAWSNAPNVAGRLATALRRVLGAIEDQVAADRVQKAAAHWLEQHASQIGNNLASWGVGYADLTSYALGAILDGVPWSGVATQKWDDLVSPWLAAHSTHASARHMLYRGLSQAETAAKLLTPSLIWLNRFTETLEASFVLAPLLDQTDLEPAAAQQATAFALAWLKKFPETPEAGFILAPLLGRTDLESAAQKAIAFAPAWLKKFPETPEAGFILAPLLGRTDLESAAQKAIAFALAWLKKFPETPEAGFVLAPLLGRIDLEPAAARLAITFALAWLKKFPEISETQFVLAPLLGRADLESAARPAIALTLAWLKKFPEVSEAQFVIRMLLARTDLEPTAAQQSIGSALVWLKKFPEILDAGFVLPPLLGRADLDSAAAQQSIGSALVWLKKFPEILDAAFVLPPLLGRADLQPAGASEAIDLSLNWMTIYNQTKDAEFVLKFLLRRDDVTQRQALDLKRSAVERLRLRVKDTTDSETGFLLRWCLQSRVNDPTIDDELTELAVFWLEANGQRKDSDFVFNRILRRPDASKEQWSTAAEFGLLWIRKLRPSEPGRDYAINSLLAKPEWLSKNDLDFVLREALSWLVKNSSNREAYRVMRNLRNAKTVLPPESLLRKELDRLDH
jgi:hypothetical protein